MLDETARRQAIAYYFLGVLDAPHTREWSGRDGAISIIVRELKINDGSRDMVKNVLIAVRAAMDGGYEYNAARADGTGRKPAVKLGSAEAQIIADCMEAG